MIRLADWFKRHTRVPLLVSSGILVLVWILLAFQTFHTQKQYREQVSHQLVDLINLGLSQKNRILLESTLQMGRQQLGAYSLLLCQDKRATLSFGENTGCDSNISWHMVREVYEISGFGGYSLVSVLPVVSFDSNRVLFLFSVLFFAVLIFWILQRVQGRLQKEVLSPLKNSLLEDQNLPILELEDLRLQIRELHKVRTETEVNQAVLQMSRQIAHDIRSPLMALNMIFKKAQISEAQAALMTTAIQRINSIANDLLHKTRKKPVSASSEKLPLYKNLRDLIEEKKMEYASKNNVHFELCSVDEDPEILHSEVQFDKNVFYRTFSNLLNNAVESLSESGIIRVSVRQHPSYFSIRIVDNGKGIPDQVLEKLGKEEISWGKSDSKSGSGLGVLAAQKVIEEMGGRLLIESKEGQGTTVTIDLVKANFLRTS